MGSCVFNLTLTIPPLCQRFSCWPSTPPLTSDPPSLYHLAHSESVSQWTPLRFRSLVLIRSCHTKNTFLSLSPLLILMASSSLVRDHEIQRLSLVMNVFYLEEITGLYPLIRIYLPSPNTISHLPFTVAASKSPWTSSYSLFHYTGEVTPIHKDWMPLCCICSCIHELKSLGTVTLPAVRVCLSPLIHCGLTHFGEVPWGCCGWTWHVLTPAS